ncbi:MAG: hypothetical protein ACXADB_03055 [Candidatus Hermodarchaeia archaeon]
MAHHKRKRHKNARAGCLMCKYWKANGVKGVKWAQTKQELLARESEKEQLEEAEEELGRTSQQEMAPGSNPDEV